MSRFENNALTSLVQAGDISSAATNLFRAVVQLPEKTIVLFYKWQTRIDDRKQMLQLSDAQLKDIGISRMDADKEANKSFLTP